MAQLAKNKLKPPMFVLEYIEKTTGDLPSALSRLQFSLNGFATVEARAEKNTFKDVELNLFNSLNLGLGSDKGKYGIESLSFAPSQNIKKVSSLKVNDVNKGDMDFANANGTSLENIIKFIDPVQGWAIVRSKAYGNEAADIEEPHIVTKYEIPRASLGETGGVIWVKDYVGSPFNGTENASSRDYYDNSVVKFPKKLNGKPNKAADPTISPPYKEGNNLYCIVKLDQLPSQTWVNGYKYVIVRYYRGSEVTPNKNEIIVDPPIQTDNEELTSKIETTYLGKNPNEIGGNKIIVDKTYTINFYELTTKNFGFGIERFDFSGDSRKTIQQTRGTFSYDGDPEGNFYVDTWGKGPENISLIGAIELPYGYEEKLIDFNGDLYSFYDSIEKFFSWNNNPHRINRGDYMILRDLYNKQNYLVTFKSRKYPQSVERQSILPFEFNFIVMGRTK
jgi:hypothetical protein